MPIPRSLFIKIFVAIALLSSGVASQQTSGSDISVARCWEFPAEGVVGLTTDGRDIFAALENGHVVALSSRGEKLWETDLGGTMDRRLAVRDGFVAVRSTNGPDATIKLLSSATGLPTANDLQTRSMSTPATMPPGATAYAASVEGAAYGDDHGYVTVRRGQETIWRFRTGGSISALMPIGSGFLVLSRDNFAYSLSARNGTLRWKKRLPGRVAHFVVSDGKLLVSTLDQHGASLVDISTGRLVGQIPFQSDEELVTDPVALDKRFVVATGRAISSFAPGICSIK